MYSNRTHHVLLGSKGKVRDIRWNDDLIGETETVTRGTCQGEKHRGYLPQVPNQSSFSFLQVAQATLFTMGLIQKVYFSFMKKASQTVSIILSPIVVNNI